MSGQVLALRDFLDRGFFDALVWLELQKRRGQVDAEEAEVFERFVLLDRWRTLVDVSCVMKVEPDVAMEREKHDRLLERQGSVMNPEALALFNEVLESCQRAHESSFDFLPIDAGSGDRAVVASRIVSELLQGIGPWVDPTIAGVPRPVMEELHQRHGAAMPWDAWDSMRTHIEARRRSEAERDTGWVQLIACGIPVWEQGAFVFERTQQSKVAKYGTHALWRSMHVETTHIDQARDATFVANSVRERLYESLHVRVGLGTPASLEHRTG